MFVSDLIHVGKMRTDMVNMVVAGCGTGKTTWATSQLAEQLNVKPGRIILVTSRALAVEQLGTAGEANVCCVEDDIDLDGDVVNAISYSALIKVLGRNVWRLDHKYYGIKVWVLDEVHTLMCDTFMRNIAGIRIFIGEVIRHKDAFVIGMTATPQVFDRYEIPYNMIMDEKAISYKAKRLVCVDYKSAQQYISTLKGRSLIMCYDSRQCFALQKRIPGSVVLVSRKSKKATDDMEQLRESIAATQNLPECTPDGQPITALIGTSTIREGFTIQPDSGIRNVVTYIPDPIHVVQLLGRIRSSVEQLVVIDANSTVRKTFAIKYVNEMRDQFTDFMAGNTDNGWFESIANVVACTKDEIRYVRELSLEDRFTNYIDAKWVMPDGEDKNREYWVKQEAKREIVKYAVENAIIRPLPGRKVTFKKVKEWLEQRGYVIYDTNASFYGERIRRTVIKRQATEEDANG